MNSKLMHKGNRRKFNLTKTYFAFETRRNFMKGAWFLLFFLVIIQAGSGQEFGAHPATQSWKRLNSDSFQLIFSPKLSKKALEIADILENIDNPGMGRGRRKFSRIPVILQHRTLNSNGYVGMAPWRSEYFMTPQQNSFSLGSLPWHIQLSLHEYRHVQQYRHFDRGLTKVAYSLLGQEAGVLFSNMAVPNWFWEGDAVVAETDYSTQGRGRIPAFFNGFRSLWAAEKDYSWMKLRNGSLRDYVPDHYELGYLLTAYGRQQYGNDFWTSVTARASAFKGIFYPFQQAIRFQTGKKYKDFTRDALLSFRKDAGLKKDTLALMAAKQKHFAGDYFFPQWYDDSTIITVRSSYSELPVFIKKNMNTGEETIIARKYISGDRQFSLDDNHIVYMADHPDKRWGYRDYKMLVLLDITSGKQNILKRSTRYFSPGIHGENIVAVHVDFQGNSELHLLNSKHAGKVVSLPNPDSLFYTYPKFLDDSTLVAAVRNPQGQMGIVKISIADGTQSMILPFSTHIIGFISTENDMINFTASDGKTERSFQLQNAQLRQLDTRAISSLGVYQPSTRNGNWVMQAFSAVGHRLIMGKQDNFPPVDMQKFLSSDEQGPYPWAVKTPEYAAIVNKATVSVPDTGNYHRARNLFRFHSLRPYFSDPDYTLTLASENVLNDLLSEISFTYNANEGYKQLGASVVYGGLYPRIRAGLDYTIDRLAPFRNSSIYWNTLEPRVGLSLPLNFSSKENYRFLNTGADLVYNIPSFKGAWKDSVSAENFGYINLSLGWSSQVQQARKHIFPRFAHSVSLGYKRGISSRFDQQLLSTAALYLPGLFPTHNLVLQGAAQWRDKERITYTNNFPFSRGYHEMNFKQMFKAGMNYHFPIAYPDRGLLNIVYLLRVRANGFFDYTRALDINQNSLEFRTVGGEIYFDTRWWNQQPVSFGIRYNYLLDKTNVFSGNTIEFILPINLIPARN